MYERLIRANLPRVRDAVAEAAERSGRRAEDVEIVAVTKGHRTAAILAAVEAGLEAVGENRIEELVRKQGEVGRARCRWHMIGHLQSRRASQVHGRVDLLHSVDSLRLAERLERTGGETPTPSRVSVLIQVNTSGEDAKSGLAREGAEESIGQILEVAAVEVRGLMTMAPWTEDERVLRTAFRRLRELGERVRASDARLGPELSMGMSNDYSIAVEEGSTMVRVGTALLGERGG